MKSIIRIVVMICMAGIVKAEDGHELWLRGTTTATVEVTSAGQSPTLEIAVQELKQGWQGDEGAAVELTRVSDESLGQEGFRLTDGAIQANTDQGILYGVYDLLRRQQLGVPARETVSVPDYEHRLLNHWDNLNGSIERGYAGQSIFWHRGENAFVTTESDRKLWQEYARANASIGINGSVLNNVNASPDMLKAQTLGRVKDIADVLRPYGIQVYLSVKFSSPAMIGGLETSDPLDPEVIQWWNEKVKEIYALIPDFGGFLVKANSEGQPGPQDFGRTHADGANMLADALEPYGGIVMWRAFVYKSDGEDRAKQAYNEFVPLDGEFRDNVIIQTKNGPVDFQPREPFSPLFGAMKKTSVMPELQVTQEYLGHSVHLVFLSTMWEEFLKSETYQEGKGSTVARCTDGSIYPQKHTAIAGVSNIGLDRNWCGHHFAQANWYAFGRLAWNHEMPSAQIAEEWIKLTFSNSSPEQSSAAVFSNWTQQFMNPVKQMMLESKEAAVNYMMPLGLHHIFSSHEHYGPGPWYAPRGVRKDWTPPYYHNADETGLGFDRTPSGSNATSQYEEPLRSLFNNIETCPEVFLLWFHHVPWDHTLKSGRTLWDELCYRYDDGLQQVHQFQKVWDRAGQYVDAERFAHVQSRLEEQGRNAQLWKDGCLLYFQQFSKLPIPGDIEPPMNDLDDIMRIRDFHE